MNPTAKVKVNSLFLHQPLIVKPNVGLLEMLTVFREGHRHLALVAPDPIKARLSFRDEKIPKDYARVVGMVTLENVLEKILQEEIIDETDRVNNIAEMTTVKRFKQKANTVATDYITGSDYSEKKIILPDRDGGALIARTVSPTYSSRVHDSRIYGTILVIPHFKLLYSLDFRVDSLEQANF